MISVSDSGSRKYHGFFLLSLTRVDVVKLQSDTKNLFSTLGSLENQQDHLSKEGMATAKNVGSTVLRLDVLITNRRRMPSLPPLCLEPRFGKGQTLGDVLQVERTGWV